MIKFISSHRIIFLSGAFILLLILLFFGNYAIVRANPGGYDFFTHWYSTRIYVKDGINPYSEVSNLRLSEAMEGELTPEEDEIFRFAVPLFSVILLTPFSLVGDYSIARALWMSFLESALAILGWFLLNRLFFQKTVLLIVILGLILFFSLASVSALLNGSMVIPGFVLFTLAGVFLLRNNDELAGIMLAFSMVKAEIFLPGVLLILTWSAIRNRARILWWFLGAFSLLIGFSFLLVPDWLISYLKIVLNYLAINPLRAFPVDENSMTVRLNLLKVAVISGLLVFEWIIIKEQGRRKLTWNLSLLLLVLPWFSRSSHVELMLLYIPSLIIVITLFWDIWKERVSLITIFIPILLFLMAWSMSGVFIPNISIVLSSIILYVGQPLVIFLLLYWIRWWIIRSEKFTTLPA